MCRRLSLARVTIAVVIAASSPACKGSVTPLSPDNLALGPPPGATQQCRTYATGWSSTATFAQPTSSSASFAESERVYREFSPAGSSQLVRRVTYDSIADFIDEAATFARFLSRRTDTCAERNRCAGGLVVAETSTYDQQRRRSSTTLRLNGLPLYVDDYDQWDALGRPTGGTRSEIQCTSRVVFAYDDGARTFSVAPAGPNAGFCLGLSFGMSQTYDADGNVISETTVAGGTSTTITNTITSTSQVCKN